MEKNCTRFGIRLLWVLILCAALAPCAFAADASARNSNVSLELVYGIVAAVSLLLVFGYRATAKNNEIWVTLLFVSVFVVNLGYFLLSVSKTLPMAMWANRVAYLGSVLLPLCMLRIIMSVCHVRMRRPVLCVLGVISALVFALAASGGWLTLYYKDVELVFVNGAATLVKEYGILHSVYYYYLFAYFAMMVGVIIKASKQEVPKKYGAFLAVLVFLNIAVWFMEQQIRWEFEFLSVSYVVTEILMLLVYDMMRDEELTVLEECAETADKSELEKLTVREREVLELLLSDKKRKEIAEELFVTENTIKKHTTHIYEKLGVADRSELRLKLRKQ